MAVWLVPALKAVLPHLGTIISATLPAFTKKKADAVANQTLLLQQQIAELQSAAAQNAAHIKELAEQLQGTVAALEHARNGVRSCLLLPPPARSNPLPAIGAKGRIAIAARQPAKRRKDPPCLI
jgi:hypothetical protein